MVAAMHFLDQAAAAADTAVVVPRCGWLILSVLLVAAAAMTAPLATVSVPQAVLSLGGLAFLTPSGLLPPPQIQIQMMIRRAHSSQEVAALSPPSVTPHRVGMPGPAHAHVHVARAHAPAISSSVGRRAAFELLKWQEIA
jgi:hypothetical protein